MKKLTSLILSLLLLFSVSATAFAADQLEEPPFTQDQFEQINDTRSVLEKYGSLRIDEQTMTAAGDPFGFAHYQFSLDDQGRVHSNVHMHEGDIDIYANFSVADDMPGSLFWSGNNGQILYCMPSWDYEAFALDPLGLEQQADQSVLAYGVSNGALIMVVSATEGTDRTVTDMYAEAESGLITNSNAVTYVGDTEEESECAHRVYQYGMPYEPEFDEAVSEGGAASFCTLTLVINPGQANEETQVHNVALGLEVQFKSNDDYAIYTDEAMTQPADYIDTSAESATYYVSVG